MHRPIGANSTSFAESNRNLRESPLDSRSFLVRFRQKGWCVTSTHPTPLSLDCSGDTNIHSLLTLFSQTDWMAHYKRFASSGASIFFTVALADCGSTLLCDQIDRLRRAVAITRHERPFGIDAWVVLPNQMHCIWTLPSSDGDFSTRWRLIKSRFSRGLPAGLRRNSHFLRAERAIWQRRFWEHHIRNDADFTDHLRFCWQSPVENGLVQSPTQWPFSSIHRDIMSGRYDWA